MASSKSQYLNNTSGHVNDLIDYVQDVKPFSTKLNGIVERYLFEDTLTVGLTESDKLTAFLGADILPSAGNGGRRPRRSNTWRHSYISDGARRSFRVPLTSTFKFASDSGYQNYVAGHDDSEIFPGLTSGVFGQKRWEGPAIARVSRGGQPQQDGIDHHLSYGGFVFETRANQKWKESNIRNISAFATNPGELYYHDQVLNIGSITNITDGNFEEWTLHCISSAPAVLEVRGSSSGTIGTCQVGTRFVHASIEFDFGFAPGEIDETALPGDQFVLTPANKISVSPSAPQETWSLIKVSPMSMTDRARFFPSSPRTLSPALSVHTASLDRYTESATWEIVFTSASTYNITAVFPSGTQTVSGISLVNNPSYRGPLIHITITSTAEAFQAGDRFTFTTQANVENFLVFGSSSGWQGMAQIGKWYWNGKIGFKIPKLEYWARAYNATIVTSALGTADSWNTVVSNSQVLNCIDYDTEGGVFFSSGPGSIVAGSLDGLSWTSNINSIIPAGAHRLIVVGVGGRVGISTDGITWYSKNSGTTQDLHAFTEIPDLLTLQDPGSPSSTVNAIIAVGDMGTIITSTNGDSWQTRDSTTTSNLLDITWSNDSIIAVGSNGTILRSEDRIVWTQVATGTDADLNAVHYDAGSNTFIAVGQKGTILKSVDGGISWLNLSVFTDGNFSDIIFGGGKWMAVSYDGWIATSLNAIQWTRYIGPKLNSVTYGDGIFAGVGGRNIELEQFVPIKAVHSLAEPSEYTITFINSTQASVYNNITGYGAGLVVGQTWEDDWVAFRLDGFNSIAEYSSGDVVKVFLAPSHTHQGRGWYDEYVYDGWGYDEGIGDIKTAWLYDQEYFPLSIGHGSVIFKNVTAGEKFIIDRAIKDVMRLYIADANRLPYLGSESGWIPLEFRYYDVVSGNTNVSTAHFPDTAARIEAYLGTDRSRKVFTIDQPFISGTKKAASSFLTFAQSFLEEFLPLNKQFTLMSIPEETYGQRIRVKITENLYTYIRINLNVADIGHVSINDSDISTLEITSDIAFIDMFNAQFTEGGSLPSSIVVQSPSIQIADTPDPELASTSFAEVLSILERVASVIERFHINYNINTDTPAGGLLISVTANNYLVTHNRTDSSTPTLIVESLDNPGVFANPIPNMHTYAPVPGAISTQSLLFSLPAGFTAPFRLTIV